MADLTDLRNRVSSEIFCSLEYRGFNRFRKTAVDWPFDSEFAAWVGINISSSNGVCYVTPNVGIHACLVERTVHAVDETFKYDRAIATYAVPLFSLDETAATGAPLTFTPDQSESFLKSESSRLGTIYFDIGLPAAKRLASYEALADSLQEMCKSLGGMPERYAVCLHKLGRDRELLDHLHWCEQGEYSEYLAGFAKSFRESFVVRKRGSSH